jgi:hypothetical protein
MNECDILGYLSNDTQELIKKIGCLSHPGAREWLMRDAIEKLEQDVRYHDIRGNITNPNFHDGIVVGCEKALALIKGGKK